MPLSQIIIYFISIFCNLLLGFFVFLKDRKIKVNQIYLILVLLVIGWLASLYLFYTIESSSIVLWLGRFNFAIIILLLYYLLRFSLIFPKQNIHVPKYLNILAFLWSIFLFIITFFTSLIDRMEIVISSIERETVYGPLYSFYVINYLIFSILVIAIIFYQLKRNKDKIERNRIFIFLLGLLIAISFGFITNILFPLFGLFYMQHYGPLAPLIFTGFVAYAIIRHQLFNIKTIATELLTFAIWIAVLFELLIADTWKERIFEGGLLLFVIVFGILLIKSVLKEVHQREQMEKLSKELEKLNSQLSVRTQQLTSLKDFTTSLIKTLDFKEIIQIIVNGIVERFNYAGVFLTGITDDGKYLYPLAISQNKPVELALKLLPKKLEEYREEIENNPSLAAQAIQTNSIQINEDFGKFFSVVPAFLLRGIQSLIGFKTALAIPVISKGKALGVLNVALLKGEKEIGIAEFFRYLTSKFDLLY